jgi:murein L,D-transpeptidase YcbB/YkuD
MHRLDPSPLPPPRCRGWRDRRRQRDGRLPAAVAALVAAGILLAPGPGFPDSRARPVPAAAADASVLLRLRLAGGSAPRLAVDGESWRGRAEIGCFYERRAYRLAWSDEEGLVRPAAAPRDLGARHVLVNIAGFRLDAYDGERHALGLRVIVGKPASRTPLFSAEMEHVVLNPAWDVPAGIARRELWPRARREPGFLARQGFEVLPGGGLRQRPGPDNALGRIKFLFPNRHNVYLHDTPARLLFDRTVRTFSHGCIRVERPFDLAAWVLADDPGWTRAALETAADGGEERWLALPRALEVHVGYWTAWVDEAGVLQVGRDVYGRDPALAAALGSGTASK